MEEQEIKRHLDLLEETLALAAEQYEYRSRLQYVTDQGELAGHLNRLKEIATKIEENSSEIAKFQTRKL